MSLAAFFETYRLSGKSEEQLLAQAEDDSRAFAAAMTAFETERARLADYLQENAELSEAASQEESLDMAALQEKETQTQLELAGAGRCAPAAPAETRQLAARD